MDIQELYRNYLSKDYIKLEMVKNIGTRELSLINKQESNLFIRYLVGNSLNVLNYKLARFNILGRPRNFYMSCAIHSRVPIISDDLRTRRMTQEYKKFDENYIDSVIGYDFLLDLDGKHGENYYEESKIIKKILEAFKVPYYILTSSFQGLHIIIPFEYLPEKSIKELISDISDKIIPNIKMVYDLKSLDIDIMDLKKLRKVPYSPVIDGSICLPLTDEQYNNFNPELIKIENALKDIKIMNRGLCLREYGLSKEQLKLNTLKFWKDYLE